MSKIQPIQHSFASGEISPLMEMRHDWAGRTAAVRKMRNWFCRLQGPAETRYGFRRIEGIAGSRGKLMSFQINNFTSFLITATIDKIHISDENGFISDDDLILNGDFNDAGTHWTVTVIGSALVAFPGGYAYLIGGSVIAQYAQIEQGGTVVLGESHKITIQISEGDGDMEVSVGSALGLDDILPATDYSGQGSIILEDLISTTTEMFLRLRVYGADGSKSVSSVSVFNTEAPLTPVEFTSPWTEVTDLLLLQEHMPPRELSMYFVTPRVAPYRLKYDLTAQSWTFEIVPFVATPASWVAGNFPHAMTFFEGRAYYGGLTNAPEDFWGTRPGSSAVPYYTDLTLGENPDDAIYHTLSRKGLIQWMEGSTTLLIGTEVAEYIVTSNEGIIIPGDIKVQQQSANGSAAVKAVLAGNNVLYVDSAREKIRSMSFEWTKDAWQSRDLTFIAEHLCKDTSKLLGMGYAGAPDNILWAITVDGCLVGITYDALSQTAGFHYHTSQGHLISTAIRRFNGVDELWALFDRDGEGTEMSLERYDKTARMDAFTQLNFSTPSDTLTGLDYLAEKECVVIVDGALHKNVTPSVAGEVTLDYSGTEVFIGLGYLCTLVTLPRDDGIVVDGKTRGSARPAFKRWNKMWTRIISSWKPKINGTRPPERHPASPMGAIEPATTEDVQVTGRGWSKDALITIEQDLPVKTVVAGIFGELDQEVI